MPILIFLFLCALFIPASGQQVDIPRINTMPDFPEPYHMRNWRDVAWGYDSLVFDQGLTGQYQPFVFFREESVNYPDHISFGLHTAVGTSYPSSGEAINVIPAVVGATLAGIDKSDQFDQDWASMIREFFNKRPEENIYLNHPVTSSGHDWWYETMPNVFFMQLKYLYPDVAVFHQQLPVMANQWKRAARAMGASDTPWQVPYMNYRAWNMSEMEALDQGVRQPEAAGALAWIFYNTYANSGDRAYLKAAEWAMEFLNEWSENPSYELQLPYGVYTAARMNAEIYTHYDIEKMLNWCFDRGDLRGWGAISGNWGGYDCHGLIGEANDNGNDYAFMMNGYQQAAALVPMVRYDHRYAKAIAKWMLNLANASRLFYSQHLPEYMQDNASWSQTYDPSSYIGYEALREIKHGYSPYATGDAIDGGWAETNLMLYGSSHVGYLAGIIDTTNVTGILQLDLLKTDFYRQEAFPTYLYYNPFDHTETVHLYLSEEDHTVYDVISKMFLSEKQSGLLVLSIPPKGVVMPVIIPGLAEIVVEGNRTFADSVIIDFNNGQAAGALPPRIKSLAAADTIVLTGGTTEIFCTATDPQQSGIEYQWVLNDSVFYGEEQIAFYASQHPGVYTISCKVINTHGLTDSLAIMVEVVDKIPWPPEITAIKAQLRKLKPGESTQLICLAADYYDEPLDYFWQAGEGTVSGEGESVTYTASGNPGNDLVECTVVNPDGLSDTDDLRIMVRDYADDPPGEQVAFYPLRGNTKDYSGNSLDGMSGGGLSYTFDMDGTPNYAAWFNGTTAYVHIPDADLLNFSEAMSITAYLKAETHSPHEQHPISHGSWEHRYKMSLGDQRLRFTLNTSHGIKDLDSESRIETGRWIHTALVYDGADMEIWIDGQLDAFTSHTGLISQSPYNLAFGQNIPGNNNYNYHGAMALVGMYNGPLTPAMIQENLSVNIPGLLHDDSVKWMIYPNPVTTGYLNVRMQYPSNTSGIHYQIFDMFGRTVDARSKTAMPDGGIFTIRLGSHLPGGIYVIRLIAGHTVYTQTFLLSRQ